MKKQFIAILLCVCMLCLLFAGCGSDTASSASSSASAAEPQAAASENEPAEAEPAAEEPADDASEAAETSSEEEPAEVAEPAVEHRASMPGSDIARLDYTNEVSLPLADGAELTMLTPAVNLMGPLANLGIENYNGFEYMQELEAQTGVHVETIEVNFFTASEQYNVIIASGDYPDMFKNIGTYYSTGLAGAQADEIIIDLTDDLPEYAPNYDFLIHSNADETPYFLVDGMALQFMGTYDSFINNQGLVIRKDWLEDLGMDVPQTYDELHDALLAFKNEKGASTPIYMTNNCNITTLTEGYNVASFAASGNAGGAGGAAAGLPYFVDNGEIKCTLVEDDFRDYLKMLNSWLDEGLMDPDFISIEYDPFSSYLDGQITSNQMGVWPTSGEGVDKYTVPVTCMPSPVQNKGDMQHLTEMTLAPADDITSISISTGCEDPETAMQWLDYWFSEDGILLFNFGLEGTDFELDSNGTPLFTDAVVNNDFGLPVSQYMRCRCAFGTMPSLMLRYRSAYLNADLVNEAWDVWTSNLDGTMAVSSNVTMTTEAAEEEGRIASDILTYANQKVAQFAIGDADIDAEWDSFVADLRSMNIDRCIELKQEAYDSTVG